MPNEHLQKYLKQVGIDASSPNWNHVDPNVSGHTGTVNVNALNQIASSRAGVPPIQTGSPLISSSDSLGEYKTLSENITNRQPDPKELAKAETKTAPVQQQTLAGMEKTGDAFTDAYLASRNKVHADVDAWRVEKTAEVKALLPQTLAMINSTYRASVMNIEATYSGLIENQIKINNLDMSRVKAYGVQNGAQYMPLEYTSAISTREREHANSIKALENERNALLARAESAREEGRVGAMRQSVLDVQNIEKEMQNRISFLMKEVETRAEAIQMAREKKERERVEAVQKQLQRASMMYLKDFDEAGDPEAVAKVVNGIIRDSGGILTPDDAYDVYNTMASASSRARDAKIKAEKDRLSIEKDKSALEKDKMSMRKTEADIANVQNTIFNRNRNTDSLIANRSGEKVSKPKVFADINKALKLTNTDGNPVIGDDGFVNPKFLNELIESAKEDGVSRKEFLEEYAHLINTADDRINDYKLTQKEKDALRGF